MKILVTGGIGFLGANLCNKLVRDGHDVVSMDVRTTSDAAARLLDSRVYRHVGDVRNSVDFPNGDYDQVYHLACPASPPRYQADPLFTLETCFLGTRNALQFAKARGARLLFTSTSEIYGDPQVTPQDESYRGWVNNVGDRALYDNGKRIGETLCHEFGKTQDVRTVRIFNSILADQFTVLLDGDQLRIDKIEDLSVVGLNPNKRVFMVPAFDPSTGRIAFRRANALLKIPTTTDRDAFEITTARGHSVKVTGDHSVFVRDCETGRPVAKSARKLTLQDYIAVPRQIALDSVDVADLDLKPFSSSVRFESLSEKLVEFREEYTSAVLSRYSGSNALYSAKAHVDEAIQLSEAYTTELNQIGIGVPPSAEVRANNSGVWLPATVKLTDDVLWMMGLWLAEGSSYAKDGTYYINFASDQQFVDRAAEILRSSFRVNADTTFSTTPVAYAHSRVLVNLFDSLGLKGYSKERRIPPWILRLPLNKLAAFLEGYRCGDGTHNGDEHELGITFTTVSEGLVADLSFALNRFGIVASVGHYETTYKQKYGERRFPFHTVRTGRLCNANILSWVGAQPEQKGLRTTDTFGDLVFLKIKKIESCAVTEFVYDFSVPGCENFLAGTGGTMCHNTYGPGMDADDGRVVSNFIMQSLTKQPHTIYGDGSQTRSLCYVDDMIDGLVLAMNARELSQPVNLGNPNEMPVFHISTAVEHKLGLVERVFKPLPEDDPLQRRPDISRARACLGWSPKVDLGDGLIKTIEWFKGGLK